MDEISDHNQMFPLARKHAGGNACRDICSSKPSSKAAHKIQGAIVLSAQDPLMRRSQRFTRTGSMLATRDEPHEQRHWLKTQLIQAVCPITNLCCHAVLATENTCHADMRWTGWHREVL